MENSDSPDNPENLDDGSRTKQLHGHTKWELSAEALNKLLNSFSGNSEEASRQYVVMQAKLVRYFEWQGCPLAEALADEVINRVTRRIDEGENISNLSAYFFTTAHLVCKESSRDRSRNSIPIEKMPAIQVKETFQDEHQETRLSCLDRCLDELSIESRSLILKYYQDEKRAKIDYRKQLAEALGTPLNALRIRAHRIRTTLEKCVRECLTHAA